MNKLVFILLSCLFCHLACAAKIDAENSGLKITPEMRAAMAAPGQETPAAWLGNAIQYNYQNDPLSIEVGQRYRLPDARRLCAAGDQDSCRTARAIEQWLAWARSAPRQLRVACDRTPCAHIPDALVPAALKGKSWVLHAWASWCPYCRIDHLQLLEISAAEKLKLVSLVYKDSTSDAADYLAERGNPYGGGSIVSSTEILNALDLHGVPATFVIGADGNVVQRFQGTMSRSGLDALNKYLKE